MAETCRPPPREARRGPNFASACTRTMPFYFFTHSVASYPSRIPYNTDRRSPTVTIIDSSSKPTDAFSCTAHKVLSSIPTFAQVTIGLIITLSIKPTYRKTLRGLKLPVKVIFGFFARRGYFFHFSFLFMNNGF